MIKKYTYKLYYLEPEDCIQELNIAIFEAVISIKQIDNDYACFSYLLKSIKHKFCKLYATSVSRQKQITEQVNLEEAYIITEDFELDNILFHLDLDRQFALAFVAQNRKKKNTTEFGGDTWEGVILKNMLLQV